MMSFSTSHATLMNSWLQRLKRGNLLNWINFCPGLLELAVGMKLLNLFSRRASHFFVNQTEKERKINNIRKWEQAFRIYAAIYCNANPSRAAEIWQYVFIINKAASSFVWSNVLEYDFIFRQMMARNPNRSWGKAYNQMWNVCMTDPIPRQQFSYSQNFNNRTTVSHGGTSGSGNKSVGAKRDKPDYCWKFNKGKCKFGVNCKFVNKCSYCDASDHGLHSCPKKAASMSSTAAAAE